MQNRTTTKEQRLEFLNKELGYTKFKAAALFSCAALLTMITIFAEKKEGAGNEGLIATIILDAIILDLIKNLLNQEADNYLHYLPKTEIDCPNEVAINTPEKWPVTDPFNKMPIPSTRSDLVALVPIKNHPGEKKTIYEPWAFNTLKTRHRETTGFFDKQTFKNQLNQTVNLADVILLQGPAFQRSFNLNPETKESKEPTSGFFELLIDLAQGLFAAFKNMADKMDENLVKAFRESSEFRKQLFDAAAEEIGKMSPQYIEDSAAFVLALKSKLDTQQFHNLLATILDEVRQRPDAGELQKFFISVLEKASKLSPTDIALQEAIQQTLSTLKDELDFGKRRMNSLR